MLDHSKTYRQWRFRNIPHMLRKWALVSMIRKLTEGVDTSKWTYGDFGCSNGYITEIVSRQIGCGETVGIDHSDTLLARAQEIHPRFQFKLGSLNEDCDVGMRFDFVTCLETLEHVSDPRLAVRVLRRHLKPGGVCLISVPIEIGLVGAVKFSLREALYGDDFASAVKPGVSKSEYFRSLWGSKRISCMRSPNPRGYAEHYGFDHRDVADAIAEVAGRPASFRRFTTRFFVVRCPA